MSTTVEKPFRVGVFRTVAEASRAVDALKAAGFTHDELAVVCSNEQKEARFPNTTTPVPDNEYGAESIAVGGAIGAVIGGIGLAVATLATGGAAAFGAGAVLMGGGAIAGAFTGAMSQRAFEGALGPYYEQAVRMGQILVAVEIYGEGSQARLAEAASILEANGADPVALRG